MTGPADPAPLETRLVRVPVPVHERLTAIQVRMQAERQRRVTFSEVLEQLLDTWEQQHENR